MRIVLVKEKQKKIPRKAERRPSTMSAWQGTVPKKCLVARAHMLFARDISNDMFKVPVKWCHLAPVAEKIGNCMIAIERNREGLLNTNHTAANSYRRPRFSRGPFIRVKVTSR